MCFSIFKEKILVSEVGTGCANSIARLPRIRKNENIHHTGLLKMKTMFKELL